MANKKKTTGTSSKRKSTSKKNTAAKKPAKSASKKTGASKQGTAASSNRSTSSGRAASSAKKQTSSRSYSAGSKRDTGKAAGRTSYNSKKAAVDRVLVEPDRGIPIGNDAKLILSFGIMLILMLSNFGLCGTVGRMLSSILFGIFGCSQYVMPIAFFLAVWILISNDYSTLSVKKTGGGFVTLMMISAFVQIFYQGENVLITELFSVSSQDHLAGGIIGGTIAILLRNGLGVVGAMIVIFCILLLALVILTQRSLIDFFQTIIESLIDLIHAVPPESEDNTERVEDGKYIAEDNGQLEMVFEDEEEEIPKPKKRKKNRKKRGFPLAGMTANKKDASRKEELTAEERKRMQLEERVRELEKEKDKIAAKEKTVAKEKASVKGKEAVKSQTPKVNVEMPVFSSSSDILKKGEIKELHMQPVGLTAEDAKIGKVQAELDYTAFSFNSGKSAEEFQEEIRAHARAFEDHMKKSDSFEPPYRSKGAFEVPELKKELSSLDTRQTDREVAVVDHGQVSVLEEKPDSMPSGQKHAMDSLGDNVVDSFEVNDDRVLDNDRDILVKDDKALEKNDRVLADRPIEDAELFLQGMNRSKDRSKQRMLQTGVKGASDVSFIVDKADTEGIRPEDIGIDKKKEGYVLPPSSLLRKSNQSYADNYEAHLIKTQKRLQETLTNFGVDVTMGSYTSGPTVTRYELTPGPGTKVSKIVNLTDDIKLALGAADIRIEAPVPGKRFIGIEVPNESVLKVYFRELIESPAFCNSKSKTAFAVGKDIGGDIIVSDIASMPHLLIAGATGSGKSVCINTLIMSVLFKASPDEVKLIMVDPKKVELSEYNGIPHLLIPVVTDPKKAASALNWAIHEMDDRYQLFKETKVRNIEGYNAKLESLKARGEIDPDKAKRMPHILIIIDELADLMMVASGEVEDAIVRLSQLARAAGIHLVIATQRPSVNVITGLIKANVPSRIAFAVSSSIDSRTILDMNGAEKLLGKGDMLFYPQGLSKPIRVQGALISDEEVSSVVDFIKSQNKEAKKESSQVVEKIELQMKASEATKDQDEYFEAAARFIIEKDKATIGILQRMFKIGFNRAARIMDQLADAGIVGPDEGTKPRKILMSPEELEQYFEEYL